ncbi:DUF6452 family protein [Spongiimicrobium salis]|uniref:DUF6452 family protein n=1 Tax=Spongiimicrobium salis TaxID=1667022 RepID=UPI00374D401B
MKKTSILAVLLLGFTAFIGCEKDDICVDGDTPLLIIRFNDIDNPDQSKAVPGLRVSTATTADPNTVVNTFADRSSLDSIAIPLRTDQANTQFSFIINSATTDDMETGNIDTLTFNYENATQFISRACGFVANYDNLSPMLTADDTNWIQGINVEIASVENTTTASAHVTIFH